MSSSSRLPRSSHAVVFYVLAQLEEWNRSKIKSTLISDFGISDAMCHGVFDFVDKDDTREVILDFLLPKRYESSRKRKSLLKDLKRGKGDRALHSWFKSSTARKDWEDGELDIDRSLWLTGERYRLGFNGDQLRNILRVITAAHDTAERQEAKEKTRIQKIQTGEIAENEVYIDDGDWEHLIPALQARKTGYFIV